MGVRNGYFQCRKSSSYEEKGLMELFSYKQQFFNGKNGRLARAATVCNDIGQFFQLVCKQRGSRDNDVHIVIGADDGKQVLNITMTIIPKDQSTNSPSPNVDGDGYDDDNKVISDLVLEELCQDDDVEYLNKFKDEGVKWVFVFGAVARVPDS